MKRAAVLLPLIVLFGIGPVFAQFSWQLCDFGSTSPFDHNNNYSPIVFPGGVGPLPSPGLIGEGGETFDLEGLLFRRKNGNIHIGLTNSFGYTAHSSAWNQNYNLGDIFFGFDDSPYQFAIDVSQGRLYQVSTWNGITNKPGTYYGTPVAGQVGPYEIARGADLGHIDYMMTMWPGLEEKPLGGNGDTYVWEFVFSEEMIGGFSGHSTIHFHNTLECGNDLMVESFAVPEVSTVILFGLGMLGMGFLRKRRR